VSGSISWLYYSDRLLEFPLGVFGIALATVILPSLSAQAAARSVESFSDTLDWALRAVLLVGLPAALGLMFLAQPILATFFYGGEFTQFDVQMAAASLRAFAPGLLGFMLVKVLAPGYFARQGTVRCCTADHRVGAAACRARRRHLDLGYRQRIHALFRT
jgi:putative peptidoglycan lipid II flippase